jgi:Caspase domain
MLRKLILISLISLILTPDFLGSAEAKPRLVMLFIGGDFNAKDRDYFAEETEALENNLIVHSTYQVKYKSLLRKDCIRNKCLDGFTWLNSNCNGNDIAVIYIGTHGGDSPETGFAFCGSDKSFVMGSEIRDSLVKLPCNLILIVNSCHAGAMVRDWSDSRNNVCIICACRADELAYTWRITTAMSEAFQGYADYDGNRFIDSSEIRRYLPYRISQISNNQQHVVMSEKHPSVYLGFVN